MRFHCVHENNVPRSDCLRFRQLVSFAAADLKRTQSAGGLRVQFLRHLGAKVAGGLLSVVRLSFFAALAGCASVPPTLERNPLEQPGAPQAIAVVPAR